MFSKGLRLAAEVIAAELHPLTRSSIATVWLRGHLFCTAIGLAIGDRSMMQMPFINTHPPKSKPGVGVFFADRVARDFASAAGD
jgi:hypothetical protein